VEAEYNMIRDPLFGLLAHVGLSADPDKRQVAWKINENSPPIISWVSVAVLDWRKSPLTSKNTSWMRQVLEEKSKVLEAESLELHYRVQGAGIKFIFILIFSKIIGTA
jgi:hypothetical protein